MKLSITKRQLLAFLQECMCEEAQEESKPIPEDEDEDLDEFNVTANVQGYNLPLGMSAGKKKKKVGWK